MNNIKEITYNDFDVLMGKPEDKFKPVLVTYYSPHCPSCIMFHKVLGDVVSTGNFNKDIEFTTVNCDENPLLSSDIEYTPTIIVYGPGEEELVRVETAIGEDDLITILKQVIKKYYKREN